MKYSSQNKTFSFIDSQINPAATRKDGAVNYTEKNKNKNIRLKDCDFFSEKK